MWVTRAAARSSRRRTGENACPTSSRERVVSVVTSITYSCFMKKEVGAVCCYRFRTQRLSCPLLQRVGGLQMVTGAHADAVHRHHTARFHGSNDPIIISYGRIAHDIHNHNITGGTPAPRRNFTSPSRIDRAEALACTLWNRI
jgi:hypothetical protein